MDRRIVHRLARAESGPAPGQPPAFRARPAPDPTAGPRVPAARL